MKGPKSIVVAFVLFSLILAACGRPKEPAAAGAEGAKPGAQPPTGTRTLVVGLDKTGSYSLEAAGRGQLAQMVLSAAQPGDAWYFRWIGEKSYDDSAILFTLRLAQVPPAPANPFDRRAQAAWQSRTDSVGRLKQQAARRLATLKPSPDDRTDIWGFLAKAQELLAHAPGERIIVTASDLQDNIRRRVPLDLKGVRILALTFQGGSDPQKAAARKELWRKALTEAGASEVRFLDPSESLEAVLSS